MTSIPRLLGLPTELLVEILNFLALRDLLRCRLVCGALRDTIRESLQLQYNIELAADGLVDGVGCPLTVAERYKLLLERRKRWRFLEWTQVTPILVPALCQAYELVDGVFATSMGTDFSGSRHLAMTWLPTFCESARTIEREDLGVQVRDFAIDPSQDLVALVLASTPSNPLRLYLAINLRKMSDNKPHPNAAVPELGLPVPYEIGSSFIQIVDDVVGMYFWVHGPALVIWNWRTGKTVVKCIGFELPAGTYDFSFLSSRAYMVTVTTGNGSLEIYAFDGDEDVSAASQAQSPSIGDRRLPTLVAALELPAVKSGQGLRRFQTHSGPFVAQPRPGRAFETAPDCRLHVMELQYGDWGARYALFMRNRYLLSYVPPTGEFGPSYAPVRKSWDEWGPDNTLFLQAIGRFQWLRYVHGERVILPAMVVPTSDPERLPSTMMITMDFNVHPARLDDPVPLEDPTGEAQCDLVTHERPVLEEGTFEAPVVSRLPYMTTLKVRPEIYSGYMIDHEHLVGMRSGQSGAVNLDVYTF